MDGPRGRESTDTIRGHEKGLFSCISCISWFQSFAVLKHLAWLPCTCPRQHATTATLHAVGQGLSVCGTTKYTRYTKTRGHKPMARDAASGVSCADVPRLTPRGHPAYNEGVLPWERGCTRRLGGHVEVA